MTTNAPTTVRPAVTTRLARVSHAEGAPCYRRSRRCLRRRVLAGSNGVIRDVADGENCDFSRRDP
jgi:hypothetical protein